MMTIAALAALTAPALAHPGLDGGAHDAFSAGLLHPWLGVDHLLAMLAVGVWAARRRGAARFALPGAFVAFMLAGAAVARAGGPVPMTEAGVVVSAVALACLAARGLWRGDLPMSAALAVTAAAALFHGAAHADASPAGGAFAPFAAGFALSTALLHGLGLAAASRLAGQPGLGVSGVSVAEPAGS
jgi:urease accessory protein